MDDRTASNGRSGGGATLVPRKPKIVIKKGEINGESSSGTGRRPTDDDKNSGPRRIRMVVPQRSSNGGMAKPPVSAPRVSPPPSDRPADEVSGPRRFMLRKEGREPAAAPDTAAPNTFKVRFPPETYAELEKRCKAFRVSAEEVAKYHLERALSQNDDYWLSMLHDLMGQGRKA